VLCVVVSVGQIMNESMHGLKDAGVSKHIEAPYIKVPISYTYELALQCCKLLPEAVFRKGCS
jgi:hypothetical protein